MQTSLRWSLVAVTSLILAAIVTGPSQQLSQGLAVAAELVVLSALVLLFTRRSRPPLAQLCADGPSRSTAARELAGLGAYLVVAQLLGALVGQLLHGHPISFHLPGSVHGSAHPPSPSAALTWAAYNGIAYVALPLWWFGRRYDRSQLWLRSRSRRRDTALVLLVLILESMAQLTIFGAAFVALTGRQMGIGVALSLGLSFVGTVLPTLVVVAALVVPRVLILTRSPMATVVVGGLTYTALHLFDAGTDYGSARSTGISLGLLVLQYLAPGMFKALLTLRTGNAWVHAWAYHAVAPHVWADAPLMVRVFGVR